MNVVTDVRTTQRTCKRTSGRTRDVQVDGRVRTSGRTCERTYVRWHVHSSCARARTKIRSTRVDLISVRLIHARPPTRTSRVRPLVRLHLRCVVRTSVTTFMCTHHQTHVLQDHYLVQVSIFIYKYSFFPFFKFSILNINKLMKLLHIRLLIYTYNSIYIYLHIHNI